MFKKIVPLIVLLTFAVSIWAQGPGGQPRKFTHADTLRGSVTKERSWWDLQYYNLNIKVDPSDSSIAGTNTIKYKVLSKYQVMQVDLQQPFKILGFSQNGQQLKYTLDGNAYFVQLVKEQIPGEVNDLKVEYYGKQVPPSKTPGPGRRFGAISWGKDSKGNPLISSACEGAGASLWWPCKEHWYDEPDSVLMSVTVPDNLVDVSNGRLRSVVKNPDKTATYNWFVSNPINNYCVSVNIGNYVHFSEVYKGEKGNLDCNYYVLPEDLDKAKVQFKDAKRMLDAFEYWFGPYPFYEDGYKLVEVSYSGMEHQSAVTYGNRFKNGYLEKDVSHTGIGFKFDFIIIHESSHEWFGNNITAKDIADMWIHESFGAYSENIFVNYHYGKKESAEYVIGTRANIKNDRPIIGIYGVNYQGPLDMYYKGANVLHTLRQIVNNDEKWREVLRGLNKTFYHQTVTAAQIENYIMQVTGLKLRTFFDQYLRTVKVPSFEYAVENKIMKYRWNNIIDGFDMQLNVNINGKDNILYPTAEWKKIEVGEGAKIVPDINYYVSSTDLNAKSDTNK